MAEGNVARKESTRWAAPNTRYDGDDWGNEYDEDSNDSFDNASQASPRAADHMNPTYEASSPLEPGNSTRNASQASRDAFPLFSHRETSEVPSETLSHITLKEPEREPAPPARTEIYNPYNTTQSTRSHEPPVELPVEQQPQVQLEQEVEPRLESSENYSEAVTESTRDGKVAEEIASNPVHGNSDDGVTVHLGIRNEAGDITGETGGETGGENETIIRDIYGFYENRYTQNFSANPQVLSHIGSTLNDPSSPLPEQGKNAVQNEAEESHENMTSQEESPEISDYMAHHQVSSQKKHPYSLDNDISSDEMNEEGEMVEGETERTETPMYSFTTDPSQSMHSELGDSTNASGSQWPHDATSMASEQNRESVHDENEFRNSRDDNNERKDETYTKENKPTESKSSAFTQPLNQFNHIGYVDSTPMDVDDNEESSDDDQLSEMDAFSEERVLDDEIAELYQGSSKFLKRPISTYQDPGPLTQNISDNSLRRILDPDAHTDTENDVLEGMSDSEEKEIEPLKTVIEPLSLHTTIAVPEQPASTAEQKNTFILPSELSRLEGSKATDLDFDRLDSESITSFLSGNEPHDHNEINNNNNGNNRESVSSSVVSDLHGSSISQSESNDNSHFDDEETGSKNTRDQDAYSDMGSNMEKQAGLTPLSASKRIKRPPHIDFAALFNTPGSSSESRAEKMRSLRVIENNYSTGLETWILSTYSQVDPKMKVYPDGIPPEATGLDMDTAAKISNAVYTSTTTTKEKLLNVGEKSKSLGTKSKSFFAKVIR